MLPEVKSNRTHIVKSDWFWYTIQNGYADEADYLFGDVSSFHVLMQFTCYRFSPFCSTLTASQIPLARSVETRIPLVLISENGNDCHNGCPELRSVAAENGVRPAVMQVSLVCPVACWITPQVRPTVSTKTVRKLFIPLRQKCYLRQKMFQCDEIISMTFSTLNQIMLEFWIQLLR